MYGSFPIVGIKEQMYNVNGEFYLIKRGVIIVGIV